MEGDDKDERHVGKPDVVELVERYMASHDVELQDRLLDGSWEELRIV